MTTKNKTKKEEIEVDDSKTTTSATTNNDDDKLTLYAAVQAHPEQNYIIIGALSLAGLLKQYHAEAHAILTGTEDIEESITLDELDKIIKKFRG